MQEQVKPFDWDEDQKSTAELMAVYRDFSAAIYHREEAMMDIDEILCGQPLEIFERIPLLNRSATAGYFFYKINEYMLSKHAAWHDRRADEISAPYREDS